MASEYMRGVIIMIPCKSYLSAQVDVHIPFELLEMENRASINWHDINSWVG